MNYYEYFIDLNLVVRINLLLLCLLRLFISKIESETILDLGDTFLVEQPRTR